MRGRLVAAGAVSVVLLACACASKIQLGAFLAADAAKTAAGSSKVVVTFAMQAQGMSVTFTQTGAFDYANGRGYLRAGGAAGFTEERFLPPHLYVHVASDTGGGASPLPNGKTWLDIDLGATGAAGALPFAPFPGQSQTDPADELALLFGVSANVTQLGSEDVRGVQTVHYQVVIDLAKAAAKVAPQEQADFAEFVKELGTRTIDGQVWVDAQGLVRRISIALTPPASVGAPAGAKVTQTVEYYDFGVPVQVSAPPPAEVASMSDLGGSMSIGPGQADLSPAPPPASGTLSTGEAKAAEDAVRAFWAGIGANDMHAAALAVLPAQRSCFESAMSGAPTFKVASLRILSARPHGAGQATVLFKLDAQMDLQGTTIPVPASIDGVDWLAATETGGNWYVDLRSSMPGPFPSCPSGDSGGALFSP